MGYNRTQRQELKYDSLVCLFATFLKANVTELWRGFYKNIDNEYDNMSATVVTVAVDAFVEAGWQFGYICCHSFITKVANK